MEVQETGETYCKLVRRSLFRAWRGVRVGHPETPFQRFEIHVIHVGIVPRARRVRERRIEHAAFAVGFCPRQRKIAVGPVQLGTGRHLRHVQAEQDADLVAREFLRLIELVGDVDDESLIEILA